MFHVYFKRSYLPSYCCLDFYKRKIYLADYANQVFSSLAHFLSTWYSLSREKWVTADVMCLATSPGIFHRFCICNFCCFIGCPNTGKCGIFIVNCTLDTTNCLLSLLQCFLIRILSCQMPSFLSCIFVLFISPIHYFTLCKFVYSSIVNPNLYFRSIPCTGHSVGKSSGSQNCKSFLDRLTPFTCIIILKYILPHFHDTNL